MPKRDDTSSAELRSLGMKATGPRTKILEIFQASAAQGVRHMSAEDVYRALVAEQVDIGLATVYRVLAQFEQAELLTRSHLESGRATYELSEGGHHDHLICVTCGRVEEFVDAQIERRQREIAAAHGLELQEHSLSLFGVCVKPNCPHRPPD
jgi:Fur family ferric uptake transcriptional regulator